MREKSFYFIIMLIAILTFSCEDNLAPVPDEDLIVVRAYIYAGQPVKDINLMSTLALDDESIKAVPVDSAEVILKRGVESWTLEPVYHYDTTETDTVFDITYAYPDSDLVVVQGDSFNLEINYAGQQLTAETLVPTAPDNFKASIDTLWVPEFKRNIDYVRWIFADSNIVRLYWDNPDTMLASNITHFGRHDIVLFHVQSDYVLLYQSSGQNSRDLNEPYSNIKGGLGMFTAFNSDTVSIVLKAQE